MASCRGFECSFCGREGGKEDKRGKPALCLLPVLWSLGREGDLQAEEELGPDYCFARRFICYLVAETLYCKANKHEPSWSYLSFCCVWRICICLCVSVWHCFSMLGFGVIIPSKVTEISFVRQANRALSYYGIT